MVLHQHETQRNHPGHGAHPSQQQGMGHCAPEYRRHDGGVQQGGGEPDSGLAKEQLHLLVEHSLVSVVFVG